MRRLARHWFLFALLTIVVVGFGAAPSLQPVAQPISLKAIVMVVMFLMAATLPHDKLWASVRSPGPVLLALALSYGFLPALAWLYCQVFMQSVPHLSVGLLVAAAVPCTLISATAWTHVARGNSSLALVVTLASNVLCFAATTSLLAVTTEQSVSLNIGAVVLNLLVTIVLPVACGQVLRIWSKAGRLSGRLKPVVRLVCQLMVLVIVFKASAMAGGQLQSIHGELSAGAIALVVVGCLVVHLGTLGAAAALARTFRMRPADRVAIMFSASQKTLLAGLYLIDTFYADYALAAFPMLLYHVLQLVVDSFLAHRFARRADDAH